MAVHHPGLQMSMDELLAVVRRQTIAAMQNAAIGEDGLRIYDGGVLLIENGGLDVTGTADITGRLEGSGVLDWTGSVYFRGPTGVQGNFAVSGPSNITGTLTVGGATTLNGNVTLNSNLSVGSGQITAGSVVLDTGGSYGGRVRSTGSVLNLQASGSVVVSAPYLVASNISATNGDFIGTLEAGTKNFKIPHPSREDHFLRHGCTESPVAGIEYWGEEVLPETGELVVELPDYFEDLAKPDGRTIIVTGRGFSPDWDDITDGTFTVTGTPGGRFSWLVKAERRGADFVVEEPVYGPHREEQA